MATQKKEINLSGLSTSPSDYESDDGNLALALNVQHEFGAIENAHRQAPKVLENLDEGYVVIYQHKILEDTTNIFIEKNASGQYRYHKIGGAKTALTDIDATETINDINSVGNTLIFYGESKIYYYLWKRDIATDSVTFTGYLFLGNELPEIEMTFGLKCNVYDYMKDTTEGALGYKDGFRIYVPDTDVQDSGIGGISHVFNEKDVTKATEAVFGIINRFQGDWCSEKGYFSQPFLVRYALRLFDGSYTHHSAPILMVPATGANPTVPIIRARHEPGTNDNYIDIDCIGIGGSLYYYLKDKSELASNEWKDIIKGVDIFVSAPIYTYDSTEKVKRFTMPHWGDDSFYNNEQSGSAVMATLEEHVKDERSFGSIYQYNVDQKHTIWDLYSLVGEPLPLALHNPNITIDKSQPDGDDYDLMLAQQDEVGNYKYKIARIDGHMYEATSVTSLENIFYPVSFVHVPKKSDGSIDKEIRECSNFYLVKSIDTEDLKDNNQRTEVKIEKGVLGSLVTQETLDDDFESHDVILPKHVATYNNRLNMANVRKKYFNGFTTYSLFQRLSGTKKASVRIWLKIDGVDHSVLRIGSATKDLFNDDFRFPYIFYPDPKAYKAEVFFNDDNHTKYTIPMREHTGLNGAVGYIGIDAIRTGTVTTSNEAEPTNTTSEPIIANMPNYLYTSEVNNPFKFKAANVERIGGGEIIALAPAAQALSQGQFGEFPMYCFTDEGIWALSSSQTGGWISKQPFARDIPLDASMILQMDKDILFASKRGLMVVSGSKTECISEVFDGPDDNDISVLPQISSVFGLTGITGNLSDYNKPFRKFLETGNMMYDYVHQKILIGNKNSRIVYAFSIKDKLWSTMVQKVINPVNSYPECYAVTKDLTNGNMLVDFAATDGVASESAMPMKGLIITRPLKLDHTDYLKELRTLMVRGDFDRSHVGVAVYGSRDLANWLMVASRDGNRVSSKHGSGFKYFRVAIITNLTATESISSLSIEYEIKQNDKIR